MLDMMLYYWKDARQYRQKNRQLWWDMGYKRTLGERVEEALAGVGRCMRRRIETRRQAGGQSLAWTGRVRAQLGRGW